MKRNFSETAYRQYLDLTYPKGIQLEHAWYKDAADLQKKSEATFRTMYNEWIEWHEREGGYNSTGCYSS